MNRRRDLFYLDLYAVLTGACGVLTLWKGTS